MNNFFDQAKKLSHRQSKEIAAFCGSVALLLLVAGFIAGGGTARIGQSIAANGISPGSQTANILPCSWFNDCSFSTQISYGLDANTTSITLGQPVTLTWTAYGSTLGMNGADCMQGYSPIYNCSLTGVGAVGTQCIDDPNYPTQQCTYDAYGVPSCSTVYVDNPCGNIDTSGAAPSGTAVVYPNTTTTYNFCGTDYWGTQDGNNFMAFPFPTPCPSVTVTVSCPSGYTGAPPNCVLPPPPPSAPTPFVSIDAGAGSGVTRTVTVGTPITITATFTPGSGDTIVHTSVVDYLFNAVPGISIAVPPTTKSYVFTPTTAGTYVFYPSVQTTVYPAWNNYSKSVTVIVNPAAIPDACTDIPGTQGTPPSGCIGPTPSTPGSCIPTGGSYSSGSDTCSCPAGTTLQGNACVAGSPSCANGLANAYAPSCVCPVGQHQSGSLCVANAPAVCANGLNSSYAPSCTCPAGQIQSGSLCVLQGSIVSFTASPSRVLKGNTATVSWSTSGMTSCSLSSLVSTGSTVLSSLLSTSITPVINSKTIFTLTCSDASDASYSASATVNLIPQTIEQ